MENNIIGGGNIYIAWFDGDISYMEVIILERESRILLYSSSSG